MKIGDQANRVNCMQHFAEKHELIIFNYCEKLQVSDN